MQDSRLRVRAAEMNAYANRHGMKNALKETYGPDSYFAMQMNQHDDG